MIKKSVLALLLIAAVLASCNKQPVTEIDRIKQSGVLKVGVMPDIPGLGFFNSSTGLYEGLEVELGRLIAEDLLGSPGKAAFTELKVRTRGSLLESGVVDLVIAAFTITEERKEIFNFSPPYFIDSLGFMVKKDSDLKGIEDMEGKIFGMVRDTTSRSAFEAPGFGAEAGYEIIEFSDYPEIKEALEKGIVDVFLADRSILHGYEDEHTIILPDAFAPQYYGIVCRKNDAALAAYVETLVAKWLLDGTIDELIKKTGLF
jgi:putative glutamine transport system substrate-binding protein